MGRKDKSLTQENSKIIGTDSQSQEDGTCLVSERMVPFFWGSASEVSAYYVR